MGVSGPIAVICPAKLSVQTDTNKQTIEQAHKQR